MNATKQPSGLAAEVGKRIAFSLIEEEVFLNLLRTQDRLSAQFDALFRSHGLSEPKYNALRILRGHAPNGVPTQRIAREMVTRQPDITRLVDRLVDAGLAARDADASDRRRVLVHLTDAGADLLAQLDEPIRELHRSQFSGFTQKELKTLNALLVAARKRADVQNTTGSD